jgi:hypothetical protein
VTEDAARLQFAAEASLTLTRLEQAVGAPLRPRIGIAFGGVAVTLPSQSPTGTVFAAGAPLTTAASIAAATAVGHIGVQSKGPTPSTTVLSVPGISSACRVRRSVVHPSCHALSCLTVLDVPPVFGCILHDSHRVHQWPLPRLLQTG